MLNLSLSGCGFLGIYHIGVISAFKEHAPEIIQNNKISGCSVGSLVSACAVSGCCLGQMVSDVLEIALKARSHALGPLHPSFNIVDILRNGLRRILPVDAHKLCTDRVHISLTRWKDGKNFLVNKFDTREELIQALICSSFVPFYSGFIPPKFKGTYFWDGGLSNNNPILDQNTILVSPFGGEADICPRGESASYSCIDFQGTNIQWSNENMYRISKALFPPDPQVLKAMCFRGYTDAISFLKSRNLLQCSCYRIRDRTSISSVIGEDLHAYSIFNEEALNDDQNSVYEDSEEDDILQYAQSNQPFNYQEMPPSVLQILDAACNDNQGILNYVYNSQFSRAISIMFLPWTLPVEFSVNFSKKVLELIPKIKVAPDSKGLLDHFLLTINYLIHRFTYDKYQYHNRATCKLCNLTQNGTDSNSVLTSSVKYSVCFYGTESVPSGSAAKISSVSDVGSANFYYPKLCPRHRVPSICSSETASATGYRQRKPKRARSYVSSDVASSVDLNEFKSSKSYSRRRKYYSLNEGSNGNFNPNKFGQKSRRSMKSFDKLNADDKKFDNSDIFGLKSRPNRVHFHLHDECESDIEKVADDSSKSNFGENPTHENTSVSQNNAHDIISKDFGIQNALIDEDTNNNTEICALSPTNGTELNLPTTTNDFFKNDKDEKYTDNNLDCDSYWDSY